MARAALRAFVPWFALLAPIRRCRSLQELISALGYACDLLRGPQPAARFPMRGRVQDLQQVRMAEELYGQRLSVRWHDTAASPTVLVVVEGHCILEAGGASPEMLFLRPERANVAVFAGEPHDFTITQAPCQLVRLMLPAGAKLETSSGVLIDRPTAFSVDLNLMVPMQQLLEQSLQHPTGPSTRDELGDTLLRYFWDRLASAGCTVTLPQPQVDSLLDPLQRLAQWIPAHLADPLELKDLAAAVNLSPRRLQELCRREYGLTPMEWVREQRLERLANQLADPAHAIQSLGSLMASLHLSDSASTRNAFTRRYGCNPSDYRRSYVRSSTVGAALSQSR